MASQRGLLLIVIGACIGLGGCSGWGHPYSVIVGSPTDLVVVGDTVELSFVGRTDDGFTLSWEVTSGQAQMDSETLDAVVITPTGSGTIIVTITAIEEASGASASDTCEFEAVEDSETG